MLVEACWRAADSRKSLASSVAEGTRRSGPAFDGNHKFKAQGIMPISTINTNHSNTKEARASSLETRRCQVHVVFRCMPVCCGFAFAKELRYKMLCYSLSLILLPAVGPEPRMQSAAPFDERHAMPDRNNFLQCHTGTSISFGQPSSRTVTACAVRLKSMICSTRARCAERPGPRWLHPKGHRTEAIGDL